MTISTTEHPTFWTALYRGMIRRCPQCGTGAAFRGYTKVADHCESCNLDLGSYPADDAPPYFTIFTVGHIIIPLMLLLEQLAHPDYWVHLALWLPLTVGLTLALLPPIKGAVLGALWSLRIKT